MLEILLLFKNILSSKPHPLLVAFLHHDILQSQRSFVKENLRLEPVLEYMEDERFISDNDIGIIKSKTSRREQIEELIRLIQRGTPHVYDGFLETLRVTNQEEILKQLCMFK